MNSKLKKLAVAAALLSVSALAYATTTDSWCRVQALFSNMCLQ